MSLSRKDKQSIIHWLEGQRGKPQYRPTPIVGVAVNKVVRPLSKKYSGGSSATMLQKNWSDIVGTRWAKISTPLKFTGGREGRTLVISAPGAAATLIMAASGPIIERLNTHLGAGHVMKLRLIQNKLKTEAKTSGIKKGLSPRQENNLQEGLSNLPEGSLKQALTKLGRGVLSDELSYESKSDET